MPCSTGRSSHVLCNPGCADANACCRQTTAFSCQRFCACDDSRLSPNNQEVSLTALRRAHCDVIDAATFNTAGVSTDGLANTLLLDYESADCPVLVYLQPTTGSAVHLVTIHRGAAVVSNDVNTDVLAAGDYTLLVDTLPCRVLALTTGP